MHGTGVFSSESAYLRIAYTWPQAWQWITHHSMLFFGVGLLASGFFEPEEREWAARAWRHTLGWLATARSA